MPTLVPRPSGPVPVIPSYPRGDVVGGEEELRRRCVVLANPAPIAEGCSAMAIEPEVFRLPLPVEHPFTPDRGLVDTGMNIEYAELADGPNNPNHPNHPHPAVVAGNFLELVLRRPVDLPNEPYKLIEVVRRNRP